MLSRFDSSKKRIINSIFSVDNMLQDLIKLQDVIKAIECLSFKENALNLVDNKLFIRDSAIGLITSRLRYNILEDKTNRFNESYLDAVKKYISEEQYYLIEKEKVWVGYIMNCPDYLRSKVPTGSGYLLPCLEYLLLNDPKLKGENKIKLINEKGFVAEFNVDGQKKVSYSAFNRFVRYYRGTSNLSLRDCIFEMHTRFKNSKPINFRNVQKLDSKLRIIYTKDKCGKKKKILTGKADYSFNHINGRPCIFVEANNEIIYFEPNP